MADAVASNDVIAEQVRSVTADDQLRPCGGESGASETNSDARRHKWRVRDEYRHTEAAEPAPDWVVFEQPPFRFVSQYPAPPSFAWLFGQPFRTFPANFGSRSPQVRSTGQVK